MSSDLFPRALTSSLVGFDSERCSLVPVEVDGFGFDLEIRKQEFLGCMRSSAVRFGEMRKAKEG